MTDTPTAAEPAAAPDAAAAPKVSAPAAPVKSAPPKKKGPEPAPVLEPVGDHATLRDHCGGDYDGYQVMGDGHGVSVIAPAGMLQAARHVRDSGYRLLSLLSAYDAGDHFGVLYAFVKPSSTPEGFAEIRLRVRMPKQVGDRVVEPEAQSLCDLYPGANWQEREMFDMYGIRFVGHPDLRRMFLPEGWNGYPMRKDYKEPEQFVAMSDGEDIVLRKQEEGSW